MRTFAVSSATTATTTDMHVVALACARDIRTVTPLKMKPLNTGTPYVDTRSDQVGIYAGHGAFGDTQRA